MQNPQSDSALVAASDASERHRLRDNFVKKKLGRTEADDVLDQAIAAVLAEMAGDARKRRVTASYLLAEKFDALAVFG